MAISLIGPDGREYEIDDPAGLPGLEAKGFKVAGAEGQSLGDQAKAFGNEALDTIEAGGTGLLKGLTGGLSDVAANIHRADELPEEKQARMDANASKERLQVAHPIAAGVGEFAGMVASPINKVGTAVRGGIGATTALGRVGAAAVGGGAEGMLYGAGNTLSDAALGDYDITAEKLAAGVGLGGLLGFGGAGLGAGLAEGFKAVVPRAARALAGKTGSLEDFATNRALKAAGAAKKDLDYLGADKAREVGQMLLARGHLGDGIEAPNAAGVLKSISAEKEAIGAQLGKVFDDAHAAGAQPAYSNVLKRLDDFEAGLSPLERKAIANPLKEAREAVLEYGGKPVTDPKGGYHGLNKLKQDLQAQAKWSRANPEQEFSATLKRQLSGIVRDELDLQLTGHLGSAGKPFLEAKKLYGLLSDAERIAEHGAEKLGGNASFGLRDLGMGAAAGLGYGDPISGMVAAIASKTLRERGQGVIARLADSIAKSPRMALAAQSFGSQLDAAAPFLGRYAPPLLQAYAHSPANALATHMTYAQTDPEYAEAAKAAGFLPETPEEHSTAMAKAGTLAGIAYTLDKQNEEIDRGIEAILKGSRAAASSIKAAHSVQDFGAKRMRRDQGESHAQRVREIRELAANPDALLERLTGNVGHVGEMAPGVASAMARTAHTAVQYLAAQIQEPVKAGPLAPDWVPTNAEIYSFSTILETVQDPMSVLDHAAAGTLTEDQVRALNAVYPLLGAQISDKLLERITANPKNVPYSSRLMLSMLTGLDVDGTLSPEAVARNQAAIRATNSSSNGAPQPPGERKSELSLASRTALPNQQREMSDGGGDS